MRTARLSLAILLLAILTAVGLRLYARQAATGYGNYFTQVFRMVGRTGFADTAELQHSVFESGGMATYKRRVNAVPWVTAGYQARIREFKTGMLYLSRQVQLRIGANRDSAEFGFALAAIRRELEHDGFYFSARGQAGNGYVILQPEENADVMVG